MSRTRIAILLGVLAAMTITSLLFLRRSTPAKPKPAATRADAGVVAPKPAVTVSSPRLAADDGVIWRDDDPRGPLRLEGQVIDAKDQGVAGAVVAIDTSPPREITVEDDGSFEITGLIARDYRLEAHAADGHAGPVQLRLAPDSQPVTLRLAPAGTLAVTVRAAGLGMPIANAKVELRAGVVLGATTTGAGVAELRGVGAGWRPLRVEAKGYAPSAMMVSTTGDPAVVQEHVVTLQPGVAVRGRVVDEAGKPIAGARVLAVLASEPFPVFDPRRDAVLTDAKGKFELPALAAGSYRFSASAPGYAPGTSPPIAIDGRHVRDDVELRLDRGASVAGVVRTPDGATVAAALVRVVGKGSVDWRMTRQAYTDDAGAFRIDGLPRRAVEVVAWHARGASALTPVDLVATPEAQVDLTLDLTGAIAGTVVDRAGEPVGDAQLIAEPVWTGALGESDAWTARGIQAAIADSGGAFRFDGLPDGAYQLRVARPGASEAALWLSTPTSARTGDTSLKIVLPGDGTVTGKVALPDGKAPATFLIAIGAARPVPFATDDGSFSVGAPAGKHTLEITGATFVRKTVPFDVAPDDTADLGTITVAAGRSVSGRVLDLNGMPVAGAKVAAGRLISGSGTELNIPEEGFDVQETTTDEDGRFGLAGFSPAPVTLVAGKDDVGRSVSVMVPRGPSSATVELVLQPTGALDGVVTARGAPVADTAVIASPIGASRSNFFTITGPDGSFALDQLTGGRYMVYPLIGGGGSRPKDLYIRVVDVSAGARARAEIDASPGDLTLDVSAKDDAGNPVELAQVGLIRATVDAPTMEAMRDAAWLAPQLSAGGTTPLHLRQIRGAPAKFEGVLAGHYTACVTPFPPSGVDPDAAEEAPMKCVGVDLPGPTTLEVVVPAAWVQP